MNRNAALGWIANNVCGLTLQKDRADDAWRFESIDGTHRIKISLFASGAQSVSKISISVTEDDGANQFHVSLYPLRKKGSKLEAMLNYNGGVKTRTEINAHSALLRARAITKLITG